MKLLTICCISLVLATAIDAQETGVKRQVRAAIEGSAGYYSTNVALKGGYVYFYSADLKQRFGEGVASPTQIWVQPPGTPTVGLALIEAYRATGNPQLLEAATKAAMSLIYGQLSSGGWTSSVDFNPQTAKSLYRNGKGKRRGRNFSTLDDGTTQGALQLLMEVDRAHNFQHPKIREASNVALNALLQAQFSTGGFPQGWDDVAVVTEQPAVTGNFPAYNWQTEGRIKEYWDLYTLNDGAAGTISDTLLLASAVYHGQPIAAECDAALRRLGDFLIAAQMPAPQPAWAQQYNFQMQPVWARAFEPPAVTGRESQDVIATLMKISIATNDRKYLQPVPAALQYLESSALPDGRLARYYELQTNKPLYMNRAGKVYSITYDDSNLPSHYAWKVKNRLAKLRSEFDRLAVSDLAPRPQSVPSQERVQQIIGELDAQGRWVSTFQGEKLVGQQKFRPGETYLSSERFSDNLRILSRYLARWK